MKSVVGDAKEFPQWNTSGEGGKSLVDQKEAVQIIKGLLAEIEFLRVQDTALRGKVRDITNEVMHDCKSVAEIYDQLKKLQDIVNCPASLHDE